jgi:hypothetical protein
MERGPRVSVAEWREMRALQVAFRRLICAFRKKAWGAIREYWPSRPIDFYRIGFSRLKRFAPPGSRVKILNIFGSRSGRTSISTFSFARLCTFVRQQLSRSRQQERAARGTVLSGVSMWIRSGAPYIADIPFNWIQ